MRFWCLLTDFLGAFLCFTWHKLNFHPSILIVSRSRRRPCRCRSRSLPVRACIAIATIKGRSGGMQLLLPASSSSPFFPPRGVLKGTYGELAPPRRPAGGPVPCLSLSIYMPAAAPLACCVSYIYIGMASCHPIQTATSICFIKLQLCIVLSSAAIQTFSWLGLNK